MADPFIAEIIMFGGNFAPRGWALCEGQLLAISQNSALFSLLGTMYGGDGRTTFGLPDMRGRAPMHAGGGPGLATRQEGQKFGTETNTHSQSQLPAHTHAGTTNVTLTPRGGGAATADSSVGNHFASSSGFGGTTSLYANTPNTELAGGDLSLSTTLTNTGGSQAVNNMAPFLAIHFIISLFGTFPSRT
ncbi:MAG: tail fiber protein [Verrucomicrobiales bacterium]|nr:tail fiber protein [Verrucomicrobiales bacterium]